MSFENEWKDKEDGVDDVEAGHINAIAQELIRLRKESLTSNNLGVIETQEQLDAIFQTQDNGIANFKTEYRLSFNEDEPNLIALGEGLDYPSDFAKLTQSKITINPNGCYITYKLYKNAEAEYYLSLDTSSSDVSGLTVSVNGSKALEGVSEGVITLYSGENILRFGNSSANSISISSFTLNPLLEDIDGLSQTFSLNKNYEGIVYSYGALGYGASVALYRKSDPNPAYVSFYIPTKKKAQYRVIVKACAEYDNASIDVSVGGYTVVKELSITRDYNAALLNLKNHEAGIVTLLPGDNFVRISLGATSGIGDYGKCVKISEITLQQVTSYDTPIPEFRLGASSLKAKLGETRSYKVVTNSDGKYKQQYFIGTLSGSEQASIFYRAGYYDTKWLCTNYGDLLSSCKDITIDKLDGLINAISKLTIKAPDGLTIDENTSTQFDGQVAFNNGVKFEIMPEIWDEYGYRKMPIPITYKEMPLDEDTAWVELKPINKNTDITYFAVEKLFVDVTSQDSIDETFKDGNKIWVHFDTHYGVYVIRLDGNRDIPVNWIGEDCELDENGESKFNIQSGKHYDICFYKSGNRLVAKVEGFKPATSNDSIF